MKILICGINYYPEPTGIGKYTGEMASWLAKQGHEVNVITALPHYPAWSIDANYKGKGFHKELIDGVQVYRTPLYVPASDKVTSKNRILLEITYALNSLKYWIPLLIKKKKFDIVVAVSPSMQSVLLAYLYKLFRKVPLVTHIQDLQVDAALRLNMLKPGLFIKALYKIENYLLRHSTKVSTITDAMRERIEKKEVNKNNTWIFPNWADIQRVTPQPLEKNEFRHNLNIKDEDVLFVYSGNIGEKQGLDLIINAASDLKENQYIKFLIAGEGAAKSRLVKLSKDKQLNNVFFLPVQPLEKLSELLAAADVHLIIQKSEAADLVMPSKLTNILAAGRPVIATADQGTALSNVISNNDLGKVGPPENKETLISNLLALSGDKKKSIEMGVRARIYAEKYLAQESVLKDFEMKLLSLSKGVK